MKKSHVVAGAAVIAGAAFLAGEFMPNPFYAHESDQISVGPQKLQQYDSKFSTNIGSLVTSHNVKLDATLTLGFHIPGTPWDLKGHQTDPYNGTFVTDANFSLNGAAETVMTTRKTLKSVPLPEDKITAQVDRSALFLNRPRNVFMPSEADTSYTVKDGFVTKRNGISATEPERIFAKDGRYVLPKSHMRGGMSWPSRVVNKFSFDNIRNGEDAYDDMAQTGQGEAQEPACILSAWKVVSPDEAAKASVTDELAKEGYARRNITVELVGEWPKADEIKDETGKTYDEHRQDLENSIPGDQKVKTENKCMTGNAKNTLKPTRPNHNPGATNSKNARPNRRAVKPLTQHRTRRSANRK